jgi:hypothetical protein
MFDFSAHWPHGLSYTAFLDRHASPEQRRRWDAVHAQVRLTPQQIALLQSFRRKLMVPITAGAWCGDCIQQCPIFDHFTQHSSLIEVRFFDRDEHAVLADAVRICGGRRVPTVIFLAEDGAFCGLMGDRTLSKYRQLVETLDGAACPTGIVAPETALLNAVTQDWLNEFERVQGMLRTSPRLRQTHGD